MDKESNNYQESLPIGRPVVTYKHVVDREGDLPINFSPIEVGSRAVVIPMNHTSGLVDNGKPAITSRVQSYDKQSGTFTTINTVYVLHSELKIDAGKHSELQ